MPAANAADEAEPPIVLGLNRTQLGTAAGVGLWLGVGGGLAMRGATAGTGLGVLATIYVVHLVAEAAIAGGVYYFWSDEEPEEGPALTPIAGSSHRISGLGLATGKPQGGH